MSLMDAIPANAITAGNFAEFKKKLVHAFNDFGLPGRALVSGVPNKPVLPVVSTVSSDGTRIYNYAHDIAGLTKDGRSDFEYDRDVVTELIKVFDKDENKLLLAILSKLSNESIVLLETKTGPGGYVDLVNKVDTFKLWQLILDTHLHGTSSRAKSNSLVSIVQLRQGLDSHENYLSKFNQLKEVLLRNFADAKGTPGVLDADAILQALYLNGLNPEYFATKIERAHDVPYH